MIFDRACSKAWGPRTWNFLHTIALNYEATEAKKKAMCSLLESLVCVIPCADCRNHYGLWFAKINENKDTETSIFNGPQSLFNSLVDLHNDVNKRQNKASITTERAHEIHGAFVVSGSACPSSKSTSGSSSTGDRLVVVMSIVVCVLLGVLTRRQIAYARAREMRAL